MIREGIAKFPKGTPLYLRPMFWAEDGFVDVDPESTKFCVSVYDSPLPEPKGFSITCSPFRRPSYEFAPTDAKAACHYPNSARAMREARTPRLRQCRDARCRLGQCRRTRHRQYLVRQGWRGAHAGAQRHASSTASPASGSSSSLRRAGIKVHERAITWRDLLEADEVFSTGNYGKVDADHPHRDSAICSPARSPESPRTLLGLRPWRESVSDACFSLRRANEYGRETQVTGVRAYVTLTP